MRPGWNAAHFMQGTNLVQGFGVSSVARRETWFPISNNCPGEHAETSTPSVQEWGKSILRNGFLSQFGNRWWQQISCTFQTHLSPQFWAPPRLAGHFGHRRHSLRRAESRGSSATPWPWVFFVHSSLVRCSCAFRLRRLDGILHKQLLCSRSVGSILYKITRKEIFPGPPQDLLSMFWSVPTGPKPGEGAPIHHFWNSHSTTARAHPRKIPERGKPANLAKSPRSYPSKSL